MLQAITYSKWLNANLKW